MRVAKFIASSGLCSRRNAEKLIAEGRVKVGGRAIASPALDVKGGDKIEVDGKMVKPQQSRIFAYYKPAGLVVSHSDEKGRESVFDRLPKGLLSVGRLDLMSEGLLLLTTSGDVQRALEKGAFERVYRVRVHGHPTMEVLAPAMKGMTVDGMHYRPMKIEIKSQGNSNAWLEVAITEGKNRELRKVFEALGFPIVRLIRVSYAGIVLGDLRPGKLREEKPPSMEVFLLPGRLGRDGATEIGIS